MITHELAQGSPEWHAHRAQHFNASDAPAMMGCSPYKTRAQLVRELATGVAAEVDAATQRRFDAGHRFEELARPLAEQIIGEELYPCVGTDGKLSASFDGLTMDGSKYGMGTRSQRFSMLVKDGKVVALNVEEPGDFRVSTAEHLLGQL